MYIKQFEDKSLSHFSYAILSSASEVFLIDPSRDITTYLEFAKAHNAFIKGVIETHPHADFISSHLELHKTTAATIYCSKLLAADYPHKYFDEGDYIKSGDIKLKALNTPGHSPDSISIVLEHEGKDKAVFTGDTLFIGDCGRPDLRESVGNIKAKREELAHQMYHSLRDKLMVLDKDVIVYPAHGAGTLCGKALSKAGSSTIGAEIASNWSLQPTNEADFVKELTKDQPFIPRYFSYNVELNKKGADNLNSSLEKIKTGRSINNQAEAGQLDQSVQIIDTRPAEIFRKGHLPHSINLMVGGKFETWLGSIINPGEQYYLATESTESINSLLGGISKIGYEDFVKEAFVLNNGNVPSLKLDIDGFKKDPLNYTIVDIRNENEVKEKVIFDSSLKIPLSELRERLHEIPINKPIVVHCAGGYRSAAGSSIIQQALPAVEVYDLSTAIHEF